MTRPTYVTIGAGQTAAVAARNLRRFGFDGRIILIGAESHAPYQRPPLSKEFLAGDDTEDSLWLLPEHWLRENDVEILTGTAATRIDRHTRSVELDGRAPIVADAVLFATGASPRTMPIAGPRPDLVHYLRTLDDAKGLAPMLTPGKRLAVIGGGFIGLEIAATATAAGVAVTVLETATVPLARVIGPDMGMLVAEVHRENGVEVRTGTTIAGIRTTDSAVLIETDTAPGALEFDTAVIGIGVTPNVTPAAASGLHVDGGIVVDATGRTANPNIYAAGDVANRYSTRAGRHVRVEHFDNASRQGVAVANAMLGRVAVCDDPHWFWSDQFGLNTQFVGTANGAPVIRGDVDGRDFTAFYFDGPRLCGAFAIERGEDIGLARELIDREVDAAALCDEDADLWDLAYGNDDLDTAQVTA